jgi:hypothetical protein
MPKATEDEIAAAVQDLLRRANQGPSAVGGPRPSKRDKRVAARTRANATATGTAATSVAPPPAEPDQDEQFRPAGAVTPLSIFDPYQEATKRW